MGSPGIKASIASIPPISITTWGLANNCSERSEPKLLFVAERVTIMPADVETKSAGSCETSPSPTAASAYTVTTLSRGIGAPVPMPSAPIIIPPTMFMTVIIMPTIASPLINFEAPSIAP
ncbi:MAG: hypothetical protein BWY62_01420 [Firmicutes bacterium ADurb.Bin356]|nr:MAG: hypothetical protein BWY62_01420 [Firmicutes bacterium ADurb.Bin356]